ncbi:hypothetical protein R1flu_005143 [Riccia fluitans]|uniref:Zeta toxin domain-containing protein n=1 Tax=Riccia fluitans TaxID=41844 RepID=A0ABD1YSB0_9MARC
MFVLGGLSQELSLSGGGLSCRRLKRCSSAERMSSHGVLQKNGLVTALVAVGVVNLVLYLKKQKQKRSKFDKRIIPTVTYSEDGVVSVERFGDYVVRQMGLDEKSAAGKRLSKVAEDYLRGDKSKSDDSLENLFLFVSKACPQTPDDEIERLNLQLVKELDVSMLTYFSFHWEHTGKIIDQVINGEARKKRSLKHAVLSATRKQRYQRVMKDLRTKSKFSTMLDMLKVMGKDNPSIPNDGAVLVPADVALRSPVLLLIGGGMGAGKSTVVKEIMQGPFWSGVAQNAVVVEADNFKENDVIYRALSSMNAGGNISEAAELVHQSSTNAASALLVAALNEGRDVILDGTMSWEPFVMQTIAMARDVHNRNYCMGPGYRENADGTVTETYWEPVTKSGSEETNEDSSKDEAAAARKPPSRPYRVEFVGVTCDAHMAVVRGMRRAIITKRGVPVKGQLRSHKLFAASLLKYCELVDHVKIFSTSEMGGPGQMIAYKDGNHNLLTDAKLFPAVGHLERLNERANSVLELYGDNPSLRDEALATWTTIVAGEDRISRQRLLATQLDSPNSVLSSESLSSNSSGSITSNFSSQGSLQSLPSLDGLIESNLENREKSGSSEILGSTEETSSSEIVGSKDGNELK